MALELVVLAIRKTCSARYAKQLGNFLELEATPGIANELAYTNAFLPGVALSAAPQSFAGHSNFTKNVLVEAINLKPFFSSY
jgi:hypothetical protein